ncbi:MAG: hypothetical protein ACRC1P_01920 [Cellulosilyticaceae bacterium]
MNNNVNEELHSHYEGKYISLKHTKVDTEDKNDMIDEEVIDEAKESIRPYMSQEIQSVLKAMGEYLLDEEIEGPGQLGKEIEKELISQLEERSLLEQFREKQDEILKGRILIQHIICKSGEYIGRQGEIITEQMIQLAKENGCIIKLIMYSE